MNLPLSSRRRLALLAAGALLCSAFGLVADVHLARACGTETHASHGVIKSFGAARKDVKIAHEKIEDYRSATTTAFEPRTPDQIASLAIGDVVTFSFTETEEGRRLLNSIRRD